MDKIIQQLEADLSKLTSEDLYTLEAKGKYKITSTGIPILDTKIQAICARYLCGEDGVKYKKHVVDEVKRYLKTGFCNSDIWNADYTIVSYIRPLVKQFMKAQQKSKCCDKKLQKPLAQIDRALDLLNKETVGIVCLTEKESLEVEIGLTVLAQNLRNLWT